MIATKAAKKKNEEAGATEAQYPCIRIYRRVRVSVHPPG
jgi:hypothetical protein